jgi:hypothetical protein
VEIFNVKVIFENGETWSPSARLVFGENSRSQVIDFPGVKRVIRRIDFWYKSLGVGFDRADIEVWGK